MSQHPVDKANRESRLEKLPFDRLEKSLKKEISRLEKKVDDITSQSSKNREALQELLIDYRYRHSTSGNAVRKIQNILGDDSDTIKICPKCHAYYKGIHTLTECAYNDGNKKLIVNKNKEICDNCNGNAHPMGEYCQGCDMAEYRRSKE